MPMPVECPSCRASFRVKEEHAGKKGRCPHCKTVMTVPAPPPPPRSDAESDLVPLDDPSPAPGLVPLERPRKVIDDEEQDAEGYVLAGGAAKRVKAVKVREGRGPRVGASADGVAQAAAATTKTLTPAQILAAFRGEIEPVRPTALYRFWVAVVAGVMLLLPLLYVGLVGLVAFGLVYHAANDWTVFEGVGGRGHGRVDGRVAFVVYVGPLIAGAVVLAFMLKPLFARPARGPKQRVLDPQVEPLLYAFVDGVCSSVNAPRPNRIEVDCQVNASARLDGGLFAVFGNDLVLTVGLPLAAGLTLKQFAGVLAHEFGHFSQGAGMRLWVLIMRVNLWFARVVYERDAWDETLTAWSTSGNGYSMLLAGVARLAVWLTRRVLWVLMQAGHVVSGFLSRQMEYDADRYQARMVGARSFAQTHWRVREISLAEGGAFADLRSSWQQRRMPDNYPKLILANVPQIPREVVAAYRKTMGTAKTGLFDTHPSDKDRIARAKVEEPGEGIFHLDGPATDLFRNFDSLARATSFELYKAMLGPEITADQLYTVAELVESQAVAQEGFAAADRFFLGALSVTQKLPLPWGYPRAPDDPPAAKRTLVQARDELQANREDNVTALKRGEELESRAAQAEAALTLAKAGVKFKADAFGLRAATARAAESARDGAERELRRLDETLDPFASAAARRLTQALAILQADPVAARVPEGRERREEARILYPCVAHLGGNVVHLVGPVVRARTVLGGLLDMLQAARNQNDPALINAVLRASGRLRELLEELRWKVGDTIYYPFEHAMEDITLARYAMPAIIPEKNDVGALLGASDEAIERIFSLYRRALGRLTVTAEEVEAVLGLPSIAVEPAEQA